MAILKYSNCEKCIHKNVCIIRAEYEKLILDLKDIQNEYVWMGSTISGTCDDFILKTE